jgi:serine/threonine-protein kinase
MGEVYLALDRADGGRPVAIKLIKNHRAIDPVVLDRFRNEMSLGKLVSHPSVVQGLETIERESLIAFVMEYVEGGTLAAEIEDFRPGIRRCLQILCELAAGLSAIHAAGVVHRDLKLENVLMTSDGAAKISDFGVATFAGGSDLAREGMLLGTPKYVAPEYIESGDFDHRSDIYALGVIAYELICGQSPFRSNSREEIILERFQCRTGDIYALNPACPAPLVRIIEKAMAVSAADRYQSADAMLSDLNSVLEGRSTRKISGEIDGGLLQRIRQTNVADLTAVSRIEQAVECNQSTAGILGRLGEVFHTLFPRK